MYEISTQEAHILKALDTAVWEVLDPVGSGAYTEEVRHWELHLVPDLSLSFVPAFYQEINGLLFHMFLSP